MSQVKPAGSFESEQAMVLMSLAGFAFLGWLWFNKVVLISCTALYWIWRLADFQRIHAYAAARINLLADTANSADTVTGRQLLDVLNHTTGILFIFLVPMVVAGVIGLIGHPSLPFRSKRVVNIHSLPRIMARFSPATAPVLADSLTPDLLMNDIRPEHRWGMHPEEFAALHDLIDTRVLDREKAGAAFIAQLGAPLQGHGQLKDYEKALFTVFGLQLFLNDRKTARQLLDQLNRSCLGKRRKGKSALQRPAFALADKHFAQVWNAPQMRDIKATHRYVRTALAGMLAHDIHLPTSQFRWLKGIDRTLWYALHSADTQSVFVEGAGVLAQMRFERRVRAEGLDLRIDYVDTAVDGLQQDLEGIGLVHENRKDVKAPTDKEADWKPATLDDKAFLEEDEANVATADDDAPPGAVTEAESPSVMPDSAPEQESTTATPENAPEPVNTIVTPDNGPPTPPAGAAEDAFVFADEDDEDEAHSLQDQYISGFTDDTPPMTPPTAPRRPATAPRDDDHFDEI